MIDVREYGNQGGVASRSAPLRRDQCSRPLVPMSGMPGRSLYTGPRPVNRVLLNLVGLSESHVKFAAKKEQQEKVRHWQFGLESHSDVHSLVVRAEYSLLRR